MRNTGDIQRSIFLNLGKEITLLVKHGNGTTENIQLTPRWKHPEDQGATGILIKTLNPSIVRQSQPFWEAIPLAARECIETFVLFRNAIASMIIGAAPLAVGGPVAIAQMTGEVARAGISPLLEFAAFLSINLAIINILPLPALDGGRIVFVLLEWVRRGRRVSAKTEGLVHTIGFAMLIGLILIITYQDIIRIIGGGSPIP